MAHFMVWSHVLPALVLLAPAPSEAQTQQQLDANYAERKKKDACACLGQGGINNPDLYTNYPLSEPGKYKNFKSVKWYGAFCAPWDIVVGTPWKALCTDGSDWSKPQFNWCQQPWCYVGPGCTSGDNSDVFKGSTTSKYSYKACSAPNCYTGLNTLASFPPSATGCPYDPTGTQTYKMFKGDNCKCRYHGQELPANIYNNYPSSNPGQHKDKEFVANYGTTCGAWDQAPETPWHSFCPLHADWCHQDYNWCQQPWCYVDNLCATGVASELFKGSDTILYSYDTCLGTPDCYTTLANSEDNWDNPPTGCPFVTSPTAKPPNWYTAHYTCPNGFTGVKTTSDARGVLGVLSTVRLPVITWIIALASRA